MIAVNIEVYLIKVNMKQQKYIGSNYRVTQKKKKKQEVFFHIIMMTRLLPEGWQRLRRQMESSCRTSLDYTQSSHTA